MKINIKEQSGYKSVSKKPGFVLSKTSLDAQVRSYLQRFEEDAVALNEIFSASRFKDQYLFESISYLFEQQEEKEEEEDVLGDIFGGEDPIIGDETEQPGSEQPSDDQLAGEVQSSTGNGANDMGGELPIETPDINPKIDIEGFGQNVLSLIETAQHKLDFENAIINLAISHLKDQYDIKMAKKLMNFFEDMGYTFVVQDDREQGPQEKE